MNPHPGLDEDFLGALRRRRGGREHLFDTLDPSATAFVVIDMQNAFVDTDSPLAVPTAAAIVPAINRIAGACRDAGAVVVWIRSTFGPRGRRSWPLYFSEFAPGRGGEALRAMFYPDADGHRFFADLDRGGSDFVVDKDRFSPLASGSSDLESRLESLHIDTLVIGGTLTNVCCESTMRDAMMRDYRCVLVEDACAARSDEEHVAALRNAASYFGDVRRADDVVALLDGSNTIR